VQFFKISSVIVKIINHGYTRQLMRSRTSSRLFRFTYYPCTANQTSASQLVA
jgi:hypothetical protein